jgi:hypothetical protein
MTDRLLRRLLAAVAVLYAGLAGLHTVGDFDTGWLMATGRWALAHRSIPGTDVLSYTTPGAAWHYPSLAGVLYYAIHSAAGFAGLSVFCALVCAVLVAWLVLRTPGGGRIAPVLAILAVPSLVYRTTPRADLFTTVFFALLLLELWHFHRGESPARRLWRLPLILFLWVNLHPGYVAGLGLLVAYTATEALELPFAERRAAAMLRLRRAWPWMVAAAAATLLNPWGWSMLASASTLSTHAGHATNYDFRGGIGEWSAIRATPRAALQAFELHNPDGSYWWLMAAAALAVGIALWRRRLGAALLLAASAAVSVRFLRFQGLYAIVVIVVGSGLISEMKLPVEAVRRRVEIAVAVLIVLFAAIRISDLLSDRSYVFANDVVDFGAGESWWFPERAAAFIERERLPGNLFQPFDLGGFTAFRLGPHYPDYTDGRGISSEMFLEEQKLMGSPVDGPLWQEVAERRNIQTLFFPLARAGGLENVNLDDLCHSREWAPVYLDEVSVVLLRRTPQNRSWIDRLQLDCGAVQFQPPSSGGRSALYQFLANSGAVLYALGRDGEAEEHWRRALAIFPGDPNVKLFLAQLCQQQNRRAEAESFYRAALAAKQSAVGWYALGRMLAAERRWQEAEQAIAISAELALRPANNYKSLAQARLKLQRPLEALAAIRRAETAHVGTGRDAEFEAQLAEAHAEASRQLGHASEACQWQQRAVQLTPMVASRWSNLAELARSCGENQQAEEALRRLRELEAAHP